MSEEKSGDFENDLSRSRGRPNSNNSKLDFPKNSRLFVICSKSLTEAVLREHFSQYDGLEDVWLLTDRRTGENKGIAYLKYAKASQAATAMEDSDGKILGDVGRAVKVKVAQSRESGSRRDFDEEEELTRIFLITPKTYGEREIREKFEEYGRINRIHQLSDKKTGEKKGLAYVKYHKMSEAALAIENSDPEFKAVWAEPRTHNKMNNRDGMRSDFGERERGFDNARDRGRDRGYDRENERGYERGYERDKGYGYDSYMAAEYNRGGNSYADYPPPPQRKRTSEEVMQQFSQVHPPANATSRLQVDVSGKVSEQQLHTLFNIVPGLEYCDFRVEQGYWGFRGTAHIRYKSSVFAAYARMKMNGLEYPVGCPLIIQFMGASEGGPPSSPPLIPPSSGSQPYSQSSREPFTCSIELPPSQMLAQDNSEVKERLFIILTRPLPEQIIQDVFCRYGQLINYYNIRGRNYGYAKFADGECARRAMEALHGQEVCGERMKVVIADPEGAAPGAGNKRQRME